MRPTQEEVRETRNRILDAAETVVGREGVSRTWLAEVATAAEVTPGAIYGQLKNRIEAFAAAFPRMLAPVEAGSAPPQAPEPSIDSFRGWSRVLSNRQ